MRISLPQEYSGWLIINAMKGAVAYRNAQIVDTKKDGVTWRGIEMSAGAEWVLEHSGNVKLYEYRTLLASPCGWNVSRTHDQWRELRPDLYALEHAGFRLSPLRLDKQYSHFDIIFDHIEADKEYLTMGGPLGEYIKGLIRALHDELYKLSQKSTAVA